uniref:Arrestin_N domain-containing protein n=1 Tax=Rhabditophanes sp. KR3021 TaxID=114890 RepID=A0AC35TWL5_9BILA
MYLPGQVIEGIFHLVVDADKQTFNNVEVSFFGSSKVSFQKADNCRIDCERGYHHGRMHNGVVRRPTHQPIRCHAVNAQRFINVSSKVELNGISVFFFANTELSRGTHLCHFKIDIPVHWPFSFTGKYGKIKYELQATIRRPWKMNRHCDLEIVLLPSLGPLLGDPILPHPTIVRSVCDLKDTFFNCCCKSGSRKIIFDVTLAKAFYNVNRNMEFTVSVTNCTHFKLTHFFIYILCESLFSAEGAIQTKEDSFVNTIIEHSIKSNETSSFQAVIPVPDVLPSLDFTNIKLHYYLVVKAFGGKYKSDKSAVFKKNIILVGRDY